MQKLSNAQAGALVFAAIEAIQKNKEWLSQIDGEIGDGDHGVNMNKGFTLCQQKLSPQASFSEALGTLGDVLLAEIGGSMGPLYGMFFLSMKEAIGDSSDIDAPLFARMLAKAQQDVQGIGGACIGDKTMIDALAPAVKAFTQAVEQGQDFVDALQAMDAAAEKGFLSTKGMVAKLGRASRLGERSRGVLDAGATSCYLILHALASQGMAMLKADT